MTLRRGLLAAFGALVLVVALLDPGWAVVLVVVGVVALAFVYAAIFLTQGQSGWFEREQERRERRERR